jgi:3-keto-5-aminohexanoate cleavage enzyme
MEGKRKVIVTVAPIGAIPTRKDTPYIPITPEEIAEETYRSYQAGASIVHLHARDPKTEGSTVDVNVFKTCIEMIRGKCDIVIQISTGGGAISLNLSPEMRLRPVKELRPEMASLNAGSLNFGRIGILQNTPETIELFAKSMKEWGVIPEFEIYDIGMIETVKRLILEENLLEPPLQFSVIFGVMGGIPAIPKNLIFMVESLPENSRWQVIGIGKHQFPMGAMGVLLGGNVRVGMEDNIYLSKGVLAKSNAELVDKVVKIIGTLDLDVATVNETRSFLNIKPKM